MLEIGFNFDRLYQGNDRDYETALRVVVSRVNETHREQQQRAEAQAR